jgi:quinol monooxygenase YgiN
MVKVGMLVRFVSKAGKEDEVAHLLSEAVALANAEAGTTAWVAFRSASNEFGIFDVFGDDAARKAHMVGPIAATLASKGGQLLSGAPKIENLDILAAKLPA